MKFRAVLNGIAALTIVGMFYSFAFGFEEIEDVDSIQSDNQMQTEQSDNMQEAGMYVPMTKDDLAPQTEMKPDLPAESEVESAKEHVDSLYEYEAEPENSSEVVITPLNTAVPQTEAVTEETTVPASAEESVTESETASSTEYITSASTAFSDPAFDYLSDDDLDNLTTWTSPETTTTVITTSETTVPVTETEFDLSAIFSVFEQMTTAETTSDVQNDVPEVDVVEYNTYTFSSTDGDFVYSEPTTFQTTPIFETEDSTTYLTTVTETEPAFDTTGETTTYIDQLTGKEIFTAKVGGTVSEYDAYTLVCMIVANEMSPSFNPEALKAQAVAAYSYVKYHNVKGLVPSVLVKYDIPMEVSQAVGEVFGKCVYYNGAVAQTVYTASSAGTTAGADHVWGGEYVPYLSSVDTSFDIGNDPNYGITSTFSESFIKSSIENSLGIVLSDDPSNWLTVYSTIDGIYVNELNVDGQVMISGRKMRESILNFKIKSWAFDVSYADGIFTFTTYGYGHGVGMSQNGANYLGKQGYTYDQILALYFPGTTIE
ncbi:MAG: SpoIID/LytB domain-containing protein [Huintestinicola sp.]